MTTSGALLEKLAEATTSVYEFEHNPKLRGLSVEIQAVWLDYIVMEAHDLFGMFMPDSEESDPGRRNALKKRAAKMGAAATEAATVEMIRALVNILDEGCPALKGHIHATLEDVPKTEDGDPESQHFHYRRLGRDFMGLVWEILKLSGVTEDQVASARRFPGANETIADTGHDGETLRNAPIETPGG